VQHRVRAFSYFNVPGVRSQISAACERATAATATAAADRATPTPAGFPKVDAETQKGRDDMRRKVLADELAAEEKLLAEARTTYASGAPIPLAEEQANAGKYRERIARLRQSVQLHERNIEALKKELSNTR
jgi:predicted negative regulator of RcsB-dependent stress response